MPLWRTGTFSQNYTQGGREKPNWDGKRKGGREGGGEDSTVNKEQ